MCGRARKLDEQRTAYPPTEGLAAKSGASQSVSGRGGMGVQKEADPLGFSEQTAPRLAGLSAPICACRSEPAAMPELPASSRRDTRLPVSGVPPAQLFP